MLNRPTPLSLNRSRTGKKPTLLVSSVVVFSSLKSYQNKFVSICHLARSLKVPDNRKRFLRRTLAYTATATRRSDAALGRRGPKADGAKHSRCSNHKACS